MINKHHILDTHIKSTDLENYKSMGVTPYYFNDVEGKDFGLVEFKKPLGNFERYNKPRKVFLLSPKEYDIMVKLVENIGEMIVQQRKVISLYKDMVPAVMYELMKKKDSEGTVDGGI